MKILKASELKTPVRLQRLERELLTMDDSIGYHEDEISSPIEAEIYWDKRKKQIVISVLYYISQSKALTVVKLPAEEIFDFELTKATRIVIECFRLGDKGIGCVIIGYALHVIVSGSEKHRVNFWLEAWEADFITCQKIEFSRETRYT